MREELSNIAREAASEWRRVLGRALGRITVAAFLLLLTGPTVALAMHRVSLKAVREQGVRQSWTLIERYSIDVARWLHDCPHLLVVSEILQLQATPLLTLLLAFDCLSGDRKSANGAGRGAFAHVLGKAVGILGLCGGAYFATTLIACVVQAMAHGNLAGAVTWGAALFAVLWFYAAGYVALWLLLGAVLEIARVAFLVDLCVSAALFWGRLLLHARVNFPLLPSMSDIWLLSGRQELRFGGVAVAMIWTSACLLGAAIVTQRGLAASGLTKRG